MVAYESYKRISVQHRLVQHTWYKQLRLCQHAYSQRNAWPHALAGGRSARQASTQARRDAITSTKQDEKMLYFVETTQEVAETVIFRQNTPVDSINVLTDIYFSVDSMTTSHTFPDL